MLEPVEDITQEMEVPSIVFVGTSLSVVLVLKVTVPAVFSVSVFMFFIFTPLTRHSS